MHVLVTRLTKRASNTREKPPNALRLTFSTAGQPHDAAGRRRRPKYDLAKNGQRAPSEASATQPDDVRPPLRVVDGAGRDAASLVKTTCCCSTPAAIASRGARQADTASTNGRPPSRFASAPPRAQTGHPILATCEARDRAPRVCRSGRHPSHDASVGDGCVRC